jgi:hypothetical protein
METTRNNADIIPEDVQQKVPEGCELRCLHWNSRRQMICNTLLARGEAPERPIEIKCRSCGNLTTFVKC